jgi:hypothetical protein
VSWERTVFGTRREPRFGSWWSIALLAAVAFMIWRMRR